MCPVATAIDAAGGGACPTPGDTIDRPGNYTTTADANLDAATELADLSNPSFRLHELKGDRAGTWSIRVTGNWRITFRIEEPFEPADVDLEDYH